MSEKATVTQVSEVLKPVKDEPRITLAQIVIVISGVVLVTLIIVPALLGPAIGNVFSNIVSNL